MKLSKKEMMIIFFLIVFFGALNFNPVSALPPELVKVLEQAKRSFFGEGNLITGRLSAVETNISATVGNNAPTVNAIDGPGGNSITAQSVTEDGITDLLISFTVTDTNGAGEINLSAVNLTLYNSTYNRDAGSVDYYSFNTSCVNPDNISSTEMNISCAVEINYWYISGEWNLTAGATDFNDAAAVENATNFTISETTAIVISPTSITFPSLTLGAENITSNNDPITINNTANDYIEQNNTRVTGLDLVGEVTITEAITAENFTVSGDAAGSPPYECSFIDLNNTRLVNNTITNINETSLPAGNRSVSSTTGTEDLYICLPLVPSGLSAQTFSTLNSSAGWTVSVV